MIRLGIRCAMGVVLAGVCLVNLTGCGRADIKVSLTNTGAFPITELYIYAVPAEGRPVGPDAALNRMPADADGYTIALAPGQSTKIDYFLARKLYQVRFVCLDNGTFRTVTDPNPLDLTAVPPQSTVSVEAGLNADYDGSFNYTYFD